MRHLSVAFNRMTTKLQSQQKELLKANRQIDSRRRFIETVLAGVTSGVMGLDHKGRISHCNLRACQLLSREASDLNGQKLGAVLPEAEDLLAKAGRRANKVSEGQMSFDHPKEGRRTLFLRISPELDGGKITGFVVTFDDISELLGAQRKAAWADVARRIAHEIKNPLTPIQLSAERLKRKYLEEIESDPETFQVCTDTIVRHVADIGRMVDEFSAFARMPEPAMEPQDLRRLINQAVIGGDT